MQSVSPPWTAPTNSGGMRPTGYLKHADPSALAALNASLRQQNLVNNESKNWHFDQEEVNNQDDSHSRPPSMRDEETVYRVRGLLTEKQKAAEETTDVILESDISHRNNSDISVSIATGSNSCIDIGVETQMSMKPLENNKRVQWTTRPPSRQRDAFPTHLDKSSSTSKPRPTRRNVHSPQKSNNNNATSQKSHVVDAKPVSVHVYGWDQKNNSPKFRQRKFVKSYEKTRKRFTQERRGSFGLKSGIKSKKSKITQREKDRDVERVIEIDAEEADWDAEMFRIEYMPSPNIHRRRQDSTRRRPPSRHRPPQESLNLQLPASKIKPTESFDTFPDSVPSSPRPIESPIIGFKAIGLSMDDKTKISMEHSINRNLEGDNIFSPVSATSDSDAEILYTNTDSYVYPSQRKSYSTHERPELRGLGATTGYGPQYADIFSSDPDSYLSGSDHDSYSTDSNDSNIVDYSRTRNLDDLTSDFVQRFASAGISHKSSDSEGILARFISMGSSNNHLDQVNNKSKRQNNKNINWDVWQSNISTQSMPEVAIKPEVELSLEPELKKIPHMQETKESLTEDCTFSIDNGLQCNTSFVSKISRTGTATVDRGTRLSPQNRQTRSKRAQQARPPSAKSTRTGKIMNTPPSTKTRKKAVVLHEESHSTKDVTKYQRKKKREVSTKPKNRAFKGISPTIPNSKGFQYIGGQSDNTYSYPASFEESHNDSNYATSMPRPMTENFMGEARQYFQSDDKFSTKLKIKKHHIDRHGIEGLQTSYRASGSRRQRNPDDTADNKTGTDSNLNLNSRNLMSVRKKKYVHGIRGVRPSTAEPFKKVHKKKKKIHQFSKKKVRVSSGFVKSSNHPNTFSRGKRKKNLTVKDKTIDSNNIVENDTSLIEENQMIHGDEDNTNSMQSNLGDVFLGLFAKSYTSPVAENKPIDQCERKTYTSTSKKKIRVTSSFLDREIRRSNSSKSGKKKLVNW